jgi:hypothetical protein
MARVWSETLDTALDEYLCESGLRRLVCEYARTWTTLLVNKAGQLVAATAAGSEWWFADDADLPGPAVLSWLRECSVTWCRGKCYRQNLRVLSGTVPLLPDPLAAAPWQWTMLQPVGTAFSPRLLVSDGETLFGVGAYTGVRMFCAEEGHWTRCGQLDRLTSEHLQQRGVAHALIGDDLYLVGGVSDTWSCEVSRARLRRGRGGGANALWVDALRKPRQRCSAIVREGLVYVAGGDNTIEWFDPATQTCTLLPERMKYDRDRPLLALGAEGTELYVIGGEGAAAPHNTIEAFHFGTRSWRVLEVTCPRPLIDCMAVHVQPVSNPE